MGKTGSKYLCYKTTYGLSVGDDTSPSYLSSECTFSPACLYSQECCLAAQVSHRSQERCQCQENILISTQNCRHSSAAGDILQLAQDADLQCNQDDSSVDEGSDGGKLCIPIQRNNHQQEGLNSSKAISEGVRDAVGLMAPRGPWRWIPGTLHSKAGNHGATNVRCISLGCDLLH